jgi:AmiR/NasT family two-component response regulator
MDQHSAHRSRRALIVEDEIVIALDLQDAMSELGFNRCDLASSDQKARSLSMWVQPDVAVVDVCLDGGLKG